MTHDNCLLFVNLNLMHFSTCASSSTFHLTVVRTPSSAAARAAATLLLSCTSHLCGVRLYMWVT